MISMDKIKRTKLAMLVTAVLLNIFTTIGLYYMMTVSNATNLGGSDPIILNISMVLSIIIAFMWVVALIMFYEFKTDDILRTHVTTLSAKALELEDLEMKLDARAKELEEFKQMLKDTVYTPAAINSDVLTEGGVTGHIVPK